MKWCCNTFKSWYEGAGERGNAILIGRTNGNPEFLLQHRSVEIGQENFIQADSPLSLVSQIRIDYCPWCGCNLNKFYGKSVDALDRPQFKLNLLDSVS
jgi:hypothetical protein